MGHVVRMTLTGAAGITFVFLVDLANLFWIMEREDGALCTRKRRPKPDRNPLKGLTAAQRHAQWASAREGKARIVIGARSVSRRIVISPIAVTSTTSVVS